jgi:putative ABC transport system permease protein
MHDFLQNIRYGIRMLAKSPGFTVAAVICLALGIGATTAIFSIVNAVLLRPLPYRQPERLVRLYSEFPTMSAGGLRRFWISAPEFLDLQRYTHSWETLDGWVNGGANLAGANEPVRVTVCYPSGNLLATLGTPPLLGRLITPQDDRPGALPVMVLSYGLWQRAYAGDPGVLNHDVQLNGKNTRIIGVMPKSFQFPPGEVDPVEAWSPLQIDPANPGGRGGHYLYLLGRLKPGVSIEQARAETAQLVNHWGATKSPKAHAFDPKFHPVVMFPFHDEVVGNIRVAMWALLGAVVFVLLIACVNVANLLLARAEARQREIAIRRALGAGLGRLTVQFITEGILLSLGGALLGTLLAYGALHVIVAINAGNIPRADEIAINLPVLLFTLLVSLATGLGFGLAPLAQIVTQNVHDTLKAAATRTTSTVAANRFRGALVTAELSLALVLLIGSGLMVRAFWKLQEVNIGLEPDHLLTMSLNLPTLLYNDDDRRNQFWTAIQQRLRLLPGVTAATRASGLPPQRRVDANDTQIEGYVDKPGEPQQNVDFWQAAGNRFFETLGVRLIEGRFFDDRDGAKAPQVVIVNQTMARTFWPGQSPIGRRVKPGFEGDWRTIVGVVGDVKNAGIDKPAGTELYLPYLQSGSTRTGYLILKTSGDPYAVAAAARREIAQLDPALPIANLRSMDDVILAAQTRPRFLTVLLTIFSSVALVLAALGIYGVIAYSVAQRTTEFGIRMAMGAGQRDVLRMVVGQGVRLGLVGTIIGAAAALGLTRFIRGLLFGVSSFDPLTFAAMAALLAAVTVLACYLPARRATRVDPMVALRYE